MSRTNYRNWAGNAAIILAVIASTSLVGWGYVRNQGKALPADPFAVAEKKMASEPALAVAPAKPTTSRTQQDLTAQDYTQGYQTTTPTRTQQTRQPTQATRTTTGYTQGPGGTTGRGGRGGRGGGGAGGGYGPGGGGYANDPTAFDVGAAQFDATLAE